MDGQEGIRLLLVDDEEGYLEVLDKRLTKRGLMVHAVPSGTQAIQVMRGMDFDVAVVDLKMEDMDGLEVLKVLKMMDPKLQVIILTGHGSEQAARDGLAMGAFDYLTKPCELESLLQVIHAAHEKSGRDDR